MKKFATLLLAILLSTLVLGLFACAEKGRTDYVYDDKDLFSAQQEQTLGEACRQASQKYGVTFLVATCNRTGGSADLNRDQLFAREGIDADKDYIVIIINFSGYTDNYHFSIYTSGRANRRLSDSEIDDVVYSDAADRIVLTNDSEIASIAIQDMMVMLGKKYDGIALWLNVVIGIALGLGIAAFVAMHIAKSYSRKRKNDTYPLEKYCQMNLKDHEDTYLRSATTVVVRSDSSGSGGSGGGGHISGGGGGGSGGGLRGGR